LVDEGGGAYQPRVGAAGIGVAPFLGAEDGGFLLRLAHQDDAFGGGELGPVGGGNLFLVLLLLKSEEGERARLDEALDRGHELSRHGTHEGGGSDRLASMLTKELHHPAGILQVGDVGIEVHAIDALHFQGDVVFQDRGDALW